MNVALRIGALVLAAGLIIGAVVIRGGRGGDPAVPDDSDAPVAATALEVACPADLSSLCDAVAAATDEVSIARRGTASRATTGASDVLEGAWLVPAAWADIVDDARVRAGRSVLTRSDPVAVTPLLTVAWEDRAALLRASCGTGEVLPFRCVGDHADAAWTTVGGDVRWGRIVPGHGAPNQTIGLQATAAVAQSYLGPTFALQDLRDSGFTVWFRAVERGVTDFAPAGGSHLRAMVLRGPSVADAALVTEADVAAFGDRDVVFGTLAAWPTAPLAVVQLVLVGDDQDAVSDAATALTRTGTQEAFRAQGWRTDASVAPTGVRLLVRDGSPVVAVAAADEAPSGGALTALRTIWDELVG